MPIPQLMQVKCNIAAAINALASMYQKAKTDAMCRAISTISVIQLMRTDLEVGKGMVCAVTGEGVSLGEYSAPLLIT